MSSRQAAPVGLLQTENMREGYPMTDDDGHEAKNQGPFPVPGDKTFILRDGRGELTVPSGQRGDRDSLALERTAVAAGSPYVPTGDPMKDGVGPGAWAPRSNHPELDAHGHVKIKPMSKLPDFKVSMWVDIPEALVRYLVIDVNPEGSGKLRLIPMNFALIKGDRVKVRSIYSNHFEGIPTLKSDSQITLLEEEKIMAYFGGGTLYADEKRSNPVL